MPRPTYKYNLENCLPVKSLSFTTVHYSLLLPPFFPCSVQALVKGSFPGSSVCRTAAERTGFNISVAWVSLLFKIKSLLFQKHPKPSSLAFMFIKEIKSCSSHFVLFQMLSSLLICPTLPQFLNRKIGV